MRAGSSNDPRFDELETLAKGKPEIEIGSVKKPAEPPDWPELRQKSAQYLEQSKHLRVAVMFCCSSLKLGGLPGFRDGLELIRGLLEQYWPVFYPMLDATDNNDPTQRLNIISSITTPRGSFGWLSVVDHLYVTPVCQPKGSPPIVFDQLISARPGSGSGAGATADAPEAAKLAAAIRAASQDLAAQYLAIEQSLDEVHGIDRFLTKTLGAGNTISFNVLEKALQELLVAIKPFLPGVEAGPAATTGAGPDNPSASSGIAIQGPIRSRADVVRVLDSVCDYYEQVEPSSPVPFLVRRAQKLATMDFVQAVQELNLATVDTLRPSMGSAVDKGTPPAPTA